MAGVCSELLLLIKYRMLGVEHQMRCYGMVQVADGMVESQVYGMVACCFEVQLWIGATECHHGLVQVDA